MGLFWSFSRYWAVSFLVLLTASYRLWLPPTWTGTSEYPAVASTRLPVWLDVSIDVAVLPFLAMACVTIIVSHRQRLQTIAWLTLAIALLLGFASDQHRLQPWAYQTFLYACLLALLPERTAILLLRAITISVYAYSSLGKFDYQFLHTVGQDFLSTAAGFLNIDVSTWSEKTRLWMVALFPAAELTVAGLLTFPKTRSIGGYGAIAMHAGLILLLSPWGMHHSLGVLVWNAVLAGQVYWVFLRRDVSICLPATDSIVERQTEASVERPRSAFLKTPIRFTFAILLVALVIAVPLSERRGRRDIDRWHWDHWLSWALYSPHNSRVHVEIHHTALDKLPSPIRSAMADDRDGDSWYELDLGRLSLNLRGVPVLPQARYQLALAVSIARQYELQDGIRAVVQSASDRRDGTRHQQWLSNGAAMQKTLQRYLFKSP